MAFDTLARRVDASCIRAFRTAPATLSGVPVDGVFDQSSEVVADDGVITQAPTFVVPASVAGAVAPGATMAIGTVPVSYVVRRVIQRPPDGALLQLVLTRA